MQSLFNPDKGSKMGLIIGQAPAEKNYDLPFGRTRLFQWFTNIGITKEDALSLFDFDALVPSFPGKKNGKHVIPTEVEIKNNIPRLVQKIKSHNFFVVIPVGKLAIKYTLNIEPDLADIIGKKFLQSPFTQNIKPVIIVPLPHPSGLSTWSFNESNKTKLNSALQIIKNITRTTFR